MSLVHPLGPGELRSASQAKPLSRARRNDFVYFAASCLQLHFPHTSSIIHHFFTHQSHEHRCTTHPHGKAQSHLNALVTQPAPVLLSKINQAGATIEKVRHTQHISYYHLAPSIFGDDYITSYC